jgi:hypothetical protein
MRRESVGPAFNVFGPKNTKEYSEFLSLSRALSSWKKALGETPVTTGLSLT